MFKSTILKWVLRGASSLILIFSGGVMASAVQSSKPAVTPVEAVLAPPRPSLALEGAYRCHFGKAQPPIHGSFLMGAKETHGFEFFSPTYRLEAIGNELSLIRTLDMAKIHLGEIKLDPDHVNCESKALPAHEIKITLPVVTSRSLQVTVVTKWSVLCESSKSGRLDTWVRSAEETLTFSDRVNQFKFERRIEKSYPDWYSCQLAID